MTTAVLADVTLKIIYFLFPENVHCPIMLSAIKENGGMPPKYVKILLLQMN